MEEKIETQRVYQSRGASLRWGSIIGGWMFAYAFALLLYLLGAAAGVTTLATINEFSKGVTIGTGVWMVLSWCIATFIGSIFAGRTAGATDRGTGVIHGLLVWALSGLMTIFMGSVQAAVVTQAGVNAGQGIAKVAQAAGQQAGLPEGMIPTDIQQSLSAEFKEQAGRIAGESASAQGVNPDEVRRSVEQLDANTITTISSQLLRGETAQARQTLADRTELSEEQINRLVTGFGERADQYSNRVRDEAGEAAEQAGDVTSVGLWALFLASLLGIGAGAWGGAIGASMAARAYAVEGTYFKSAAYTSYEDEGPGRSRKAG